MAEFEEVHYFSNSTEFEIWYSNLCADCTKDLNDDCIHISNMYMGVSDPALTQIRLGVYDCSDFEQRID